MNKNNNEASHSEEAERAVISCILYSEDGYHYDEINRIITKDDFYKTYTRNIFIAASSIVNRKEEINEVTLCEQLRVNGTLDDVGGLSAVMSITDKPQTLISGITSAKIVKRHSQSRKLDRHFRLQLESLSENKLPEDIASESESQLRIIMDSAQDSKQCLGESAEALKKMLNDIYDGKYESKKIPTGISHLDDKLDERGIGQGEVCVIAAPTSCGKSQLALNFVLRNSIANEIPSLIFSFEMPASQLTKRMTQTSSCVNLKRYSDAVVTQAERDKVDEAIDKISKAPIYTEHSVRSIDDLRSKARRMKRLKDIKIIVIDYLQLIPYNSKLSKHEGISQASHGIKQMAMELDVAVILLVQVNRTGAMRDSGLVLYDLKDSGDIENDADIALLMWPEGGDIDHARKLDPNGKPYISMQYNIAKNREGERDLKGKFMFINHIGRFQ